MIRGVGDYDQAFEGCENRTRLAAAIASARFSGVLQGLGVGVLVGTLGGAAMYLAAIGRERDGRRRR